MAPSDPSPPSPGSPAGHPAGGFDASAGVGTLARSFRRQFEARPAAPALVSDSGRVLSYADLDASTRHAAARLSALGLEPGDRVLFSAQSSLEFALAYVAALRLGVVVVPANTAYREAELAHLVSDARPRAAIVDASERGDWIRAADPEVQVLSPALEGPGPAAPGPSGSDVGSPELDAATPGSPALIGYTSGTTGRPKGAVLTHANLLASLEALRLAWHWSPEDRLLLCLPLFHMHGLGVGLTGTLHAGACAILLPRFDPAEVLRRSAAGEATLFFGVPTLYHRLVENDDAAALGRLRLCVSGSAPLAADLHRRFEAISGQRILERYGMTETVMLVSNPVEGERRPGTVGLPLPGVDVRLGELGDPSEGGPAEIEVRGPNVFAGYWERPDANADAFTADGWFRTGDLGRRDAAGYLEIVGRARELVISGGYNVYPREVEEALRTHPDVEDAAVVGTPSPEWGELVTAYLVGENAPDAEALREFLAERLAPYKQPRRVYRVESLPRNALGKVQKHRLRDGRVLDESPGS